MTLGFAFRSLAVVGLASLPMTFAAAPTVEQPSLDLDAEMLRMRSYHEGIVVETLRGEIGNYLERDAYNVSATVMLKKVEPATAAANPNAGPSPTAAQVPQPKPPQTTAGASGGPRAPGIDDFTLGRLDLGQVLAASRQPPNAATAGELRSPASHEAAPPDRFALDSVRIIVGLHERVTPEVRSQIETWIKQRVRERYGAGGSVLIQSIRELAQRPLALPSATPAERSPAEAKKEIESKPAPLPGWAQKAALFQNLIGLLVVGILGLVGLTVLGRASRKSMKAQGKIELEASHAASATAPLPPAMAPAQPIQLQMQGSSADGATGGRAATTESAETAARLAPSLKDTTAKIRDIIANMQDRVGALVESWARAGAEGEIKIACLLEAAADGSASIPLPKDGDQALASRLRDGFRTIADMDPAERARILNEVYWEIVATRTLGSGTFDRPFKYLERMEQAAMSGLILDSGNSRLSAMVALQMPDASRRGFLRGLTRDARLGLLRDAIGMGEFSQDEVLGFDRELRTRFEAGEATQRGKLSALPLLPRVLASLGSYEEASLLHELDATSSGGIDALRAQYVSPGLISKWNDAALADFCAPLPADELVALLRLMPEVEGKALARCSPLVLEIVTDELRRPDVSPEMEKNRLFDQLRARLREYAESRGLKGSESPPDQVDATQGQQQAA